MRPKSCGAILSLVIVSAVIVCAVLRAADSSTVIAALKDAQIILADRAGGNVTRLTGDPRPKGDLRWLPDGQRISYLVPAENADKAFPWRMTSWPTLVVSDLAGQVTREIPLTPAKNSSVPDSIRAIEEVEWLSNRFVQFGGSFGPRNCAVFDLDLDTGKMLVEWDVECGSFAVSPDLKHVAYRDPVSMGTWDDRVHRVSIDDGPASYAGDSGAPTPRVRPSVAEARVSRAGFPTGPPIHVEAGPVWSEDSQWVAMLERQVPVEAAHGEVLAQPQYGPMAVTTMSVRGEVVTVPVPNYTKEDPLLTWIGNRVAVGSGTNALVVDPARRTYLPVDVDSASIVRQAATTRQKVRNDQRDVQSAVQRLGAQEGVGKPK